MQITVGGNRIHYTGEKLAPTAGTTTVKTHWNSTISTKNARYLTLDIKNYYLMSKFKPNEYEYIRIELALILNEFIQQYNLEQISDSGYVYAEVQGGMYSLPHAGAVAYKDLKAYLEPNRYRELSYIIGLWFDKNSDLSFALIVDDVGIKYITIESAERLINTLQRKYEITTDWTGSTYCGVSLQWDYRNGKVTCSIPNYIQKFLDRIKYIPTPRKQHTPYVPETIHYSKQP